jgi:hypothetical protein
VAAWGPTTEALMVTLALAGATDAWWQAEVPVVNRLDQALNVQDGPRGQKFLLWRAPGS